MTEPTQPTSVSPEGTHPKVTAPLIVATKGAGAMPVITAARLIAPRLRATPEVLAVSEPIAMYLPDFSMASIMPGLEADQRDALVSEVTDVMRASEGDASSWPIEVTIGQPARVIARYARERNARLIVMGVGRHDTMDRLLGREVTLMTVREADRPVLAVAPGFDGLPHHAAVAVDFSAASVRAAEEALAILAPGGTLSLVHVRPVDAVLLETGDGGVREDYDHEVANLFNRLINHLEAPVTVTVNPVVLDGNPADELVRFSEEEQADLIASGTSGLGFLERLVVGSVATQLIRRASVSVLVVPRPSSAREESLDGVMSGDADASLQATWPPLLEAFSERNEGRAAQLEMDDPSSGAHLQGSGYRLVGVSYDPRTGQLQVMLSAPTGSGAHLTHTVPAVTAVDVLTDPRQSDLALQVRHGDGQTILTFQD